MSKWLTNEKKGLFAHLSCALHGASITLNQQVALCKTIVYIMYALFNGCVLLLRNIYFFSLFNTKCIFFLSIIGVLFIDVIL